MIEAGKKVVSKRVVAYDEDGQVVYDLTKAPRPKNGGGFVISYTEKMCDFLSKCAKASVVRIFLYIAHHQNYGNDGVYGYRCSHKYLEQVLRLDRKSVYRALKELKDDYLVNEICIEGQTEFMVNPAYVTIGTNKAARVKEWNFRWQMVHKYNAHKLALKSA